MADISLPATGKQGSTPTPKSSLRIARQQAVESALLEALLLLGAMRSNKDLNRVTGRVANASRLLKQACEAMREGATA